MKKLWMVVFAILALLWLGACAPSNPDPNEDNKQEDGSGKGVGELEEIAE